MCLWTFRQPIHHEFTFFVWFIGAIVLHFCQPNSTRRQSRIASPFHSFVCSLSFADVSILTGFDFWELSFNSCPQKMSMETMPKCTHLVFSMKSIWIRRDLVPLVVLTEPNRMTYERTYECVCVRVRVWTYAYVCLYLIHSHACTEKKNNNPARNVKKPTTTTTTKNMLCNWHRNSPHLRQMYQVDTISVVYGCLLWLTFWKQKKRNET